MRLLRRSIFVSLGLWLALSAPAWSYEASPCVRNANGKVVGPPPGGTCLMTLTGQMLCGLGKCRMSAFGPAFCSAGQHGSVTINSSGEPVRTGGCVQTSAEACSWP